MCTQRLMYLRMQFYSVRWLRRIKFWRAPVALEAQDGLFAIRCPRARRNA